jgi:VanZ family protein
MSGVRQRRIHLGFALIATIVLAVIVYGSLYPFEFRGRGSLADAIAALLATRARLTSRGDIISNILLYVPLGVFAAKALPGLSRMLRVGLVTLLGLFLSVGIELTQFNAWARNSTLSDVYCNTAGAFLGAIAGAVLQVHTNLPWAKHVAARPIPALLLVAYAGDRLFPYVPAIDLHKYWNALKPLVFGPTIVTPTSLFRHMAAWLVVALLLESLLGVDRRRLTFALLVAAILIARILIVGITLSTAEVYGAALALILWLALLSHLPFRTGVVTLLFVGAVVIQALEPFQFRSSARPFGWIPFLSFMYGSIEVNIRSMFEKVFTYGALLWLLMRSGLNPTAATAFSALLVLTLRYAQTYLPGRSAEITDFIIVLILALVFRLLAGEPQHGTTKRQTGVPAPSR